MLKPEDHQTYIELFESRHNEVDDAHLEILSILQTDDKISFGTEFSQLAKMLAYPHMLAKLICLLLKRPK